MTEACPQNEEPPCTAEGPGWWDPGDGHWDTPWWSDGTEDPTGPRAVVTYGDDDDFSALAAVERGSEDLPSPSVLDDGRPTRIPSDIRDRLWIYGFQTLKRMIKDGEIFEKCAAKRRPVDPSLDDLRTLRISVDDRDGLAGDTVAAAMEHVDDTWSTWSPAKGAKLETYFVGGLTLYFPAVFRKWQRNRRNLVFVPGADAAPLALRAARALADGDPERQEDLRSALEEVMRLAGPEVRAILARTAEGDTQDEIAERLQSTRKAVESRLYRFRGRLRERGITLQTLLAGGSGIREGWQAR